MFNELSHIEVLFDFIFFSRILVCVLCSGVLDVRDIYLKMTVYHFHVQSYTLEGERETLVVFSTKNGIETSQVFFFFFGSDCPMVPSLNSAQSINKSKEDETKLRDICGTITYFHNFHDKADQL